MSYQKLEAKFKVVGDLEHAQSMLSWDEAVMMPAGGGATRGEALATLAGLRHDMVSSDEVGDLLDSARCETTLDAWQTANVREIGKMWSKARAVPTDLVMARSRAATACEQRWRQARPDNDWDSIVEPLVEVLELTRLYAQCLAESFNLTQYDALIDVYEPGMTQAVIDPIFARLASALPSIVDNVMARQGKALELTGPFPDARQAELAQTLMATLGFDFERGRLDTTHHPFCGGHPDDTRITTRYNPGDFLESMFAVLHETGHAMYEQGLPAAWRGQPVGGSGGMALHESQSLLMEMQACRSHEFLDFAGPLVRSALRGDANQPAWSNANLYLLATRVQRGYIRVEADELTYPLHIILRYEIEQALIGGEMEIGDVPDAWDEKMQGYLGLSTTGNFTDGPMQDVHWFAGLFGYFPTYTLGALTAAQLFAAARDGIGDLDASLGRGDFSTLLAWLRSNVHGRGSFTSTGEIVRDATGGPLGTDAFFDHVARRYGR
ncbi:MAG: carboxypeptidase M32 [Gammaproteobacteria bacterium]|nr:carboxypeptidase M32 [Gammaproteobacteria bacterium]